MRHLLLSSAALLLLTLTAFAHEKDANKACPGIDQRVATLINEYQALRDRQRRLPQGSFDKDLLAHGGRLHEVLTSLGEEFGQRLYTKRKLTRCLGEPNAIKRGKEMNPFLEIYNRELRKAGRVIKEGKDREYLIYFWRGWHDFLFFISEGGRIVDHGWWFAYE